MPTLIDRLAALASGSAAPPPPARYADGAGVTLEDLETGTTVLLEGTATPEQGVVDAGELRSVVTRYPGSSRPSRQIMGTKEEPIELRGWLRDAWLKEDGGAARIMGELRALRIAQHYVQLSWGTLLVRRGYVQRVEAEISSERAIRYRVIFEVDEADEAVIVTKPFPPAETPFDLLALLRTIGDGVEEVSSSAALINNVAAAVI